jgi:glycosyltransferase involved in cell wall biosynthesis
MKITFMVLTLDVMGGTERAVLTQADHLVRQHDVEIISVFRSNRTTFFDMDERIRIRYLVDRTGPVPRPARESDLDDATCQRLATSVSRLMAPSWENQGNRLADLEIERVLRTLDTDVLVSTSPALMAVTTTLAPPRVITVHQEHRPSQLRGGTGEPLFQFTPRLDALVVLTERTRDWFAETFGPSCPRLEIIPNAVPAGYRPKSDLGNPVVTLAARIVEEKRVDHAIRAFAEVAKVHPDWTLRVFGGGPLLPEMQRLVASLGLHDNVHILGPTPRMPEEWAKSSIALLCSQDGEALPLVLLEAFAAGVPAVSYDIETGPAEIITHGENGFLVGDGDTAGLAEALIKLIGDAELRRDFGAAALRAAQRYRIDDVMARWERLYTELVAGRDDAERERRRTDRLGAWLSRSGGSGFAPTMPRAGQVAVGDRDEELTRRIMEATPGLVRAGGRLSIVSDAYTPADVTHANLIRVVEVLEKHGIEYRLVPNRTTRYRVAVSPDQRAEVLAALSSAYLDSPVYAELLNREGRPMVTALAGALESVPQAASAGGLRVFSPVVSASRTLRYGPAYGCDLEFWPLSEDGQELIPPQRTVLGARIPVAATTATATVTVRDREYPTFEAFNKRLMLDVDFPIDVVYTWVDGSDPEWVARKNEVLAMLGQPPVAAVSDARFRSRDELRYSLRSIDMYAPWVRHVYLVTAGQRPSWLDTSRPDLTVVDHRDLFGDRGVLPTFNSHAIESQLHHIDGLAEHFLYFNDDMFLGRPVSPELFFRANGLAHFFISPTPVAMTPVSESDDFNFSAAKNNRRLLEEKFGRTLTRGLLHAPYPMRRSVGYAIDREFPEEVARTAASQIRAHTDLSIASSLHHYYGYLTGQSVPERPAVSYVDIGDPAQHPRLTRILANREYDAFCLNDTHHGLLDAEEKSRVVSAFLESYFPVPSRFERDSPRNRSA